MDPHSRLWSVTGLNAMICTCFTHLFPLLSAELKELKNATLLARERRRCQDLSSGTADVNVALSDPEDKQQECHVMSLSSLTMKTWWHVTYVYPALIIPWSCLRCLQTDYYPIVLPIIQQKGCNLPFIFTFVVMEHNWTLDYSVVPGFEFRNPSFHYTPAQPEWVKMLVTSATVQSQSTWRKMKRGSEISYRNLIRWTYEPS